MKHRVGAELRSDLKNFSRFLDRVVNLKAFLQITSKRLFAVYMFARFHRVHRHVRMPIINGGDYDRVDVLSIEQFSMVAISVRIFYADKLLCSLKSFIKHITDRSLDDAVFSRMFFLALHVRHPLAANAHITDRNSIVSPYCPG